MLLPPLRLLLLLVERLARPKLGADRPAVRVHLLAGDVVDVDAQRVLDSISGKLEKLAKDVKKKFDVDLVEEAREQKLADAESGEGEDGPVVVELSEGIYMSMEGTNLVDEGSEDGERSEPALETNQNAERMSWMFPGQPPP